MLRPYIISPRPPHLLLLIRRPRDDRVSRAVADVAAVHRRRFLIGLRDDGLPLRVEHEQSLRAMHQARAAADAPLALHPHGHGTLREEPDVARLGPLVSAVERRARRAIALFHFLAQRVER